jgi:hypothetical protein
MNRRHIRSCFAALAIAFTPAVFAQGPADRPLPGQAPIAGKPKPPAQKPDDRGLQPLPEPPPPPPGFELDPALEPQITIQRRGEQTVEEYRINGRLYMVKVTPAHGVPYYLIDESGRGDFARRDTLDTGTRVPMWVIHQF